MNRCFKSFCTIIFNMHVFRFQVIEKNKRKFDEEKSLTSELKRENQSLVDSCDSLAKAKEKLEHDLHTRQQRLNCLDGELQAAKKVIARIIGK